MAVISTDNASHYRWGESCDGWHLLQTETLSVIQERVPPGCAEVSHYHEHAEQFFFVLSGEGTLQVGDDIFVLGPQQGLHVPAGTRHQFSNRAQGDCHFIVTSTPPSHGDRVET